MSDSVRVPKRRSGDQSVDDRIALDVGCGSGQIELDYGGPELARGGSGREASRGDPGVFRDAGSEAGVVGGGSGVGWDGQGEVDQRPGCRCDSTMQATRCRCGKGVCAV